MTPAPILHLSLPVDDLGAARDFYERVLGCRVGRVREDWFDVWFFGMQLTLQLHPDQTIPLAKQGCRHLGVVLHERHQFDDLVARVERSGIDWLSAPKFHVDADFSGKLAAMLTDPSSNIIEIKYYEDASEFLACE